MRRKINMKKLLLVSLAIVMLAVVLVGCGACADEPYDVLPPYENGDVNGDTNGNGDVVDNNETTDYSHLIGTWQGYAVAVTETIEITAVNGNEITFNFIHISSIDGSVTYSESFTEAIVNDQIRVSRSFTGDLGQMVVNHILLEFDENGIVLSVEGSEVTDENGDVTTFDGVEDISWALALTTERWWEEN